MYQFARQTAAALLLSLATVPTASAVTFADPGPVVDLPTTWDTGYIWSVPLAGHDAGDQLLSLIVRAGPTPTKLMTFEVFAMYQPYVVAGPDIGFTLLVDGVVTPWTDVVPDSFTYHIYSDATLVGDVTFEVLIDDSTWHLPATTVAAVYLGQMPAAIPLPGAMASALGGIGLIAARLGLRRRRRGHRA